MVLCFGGSLGALKLNEAFAQMIPNAQKDGVSLIIGTGSRYHEDFLTKIKDYAFDSNQIRITQYIDDMPTVLAACDVAVTRAGAMTISELCAIKKPSVLIPSPNVTANHQEKNAHALVTKGGAAKISETDLTGEGLYRTVYSLISNPQKLSNENQAYVAMVRIEIIE